MATVVITPSARAEFDGLPLPIQQRVRNVFVRLAAWPGVSGAKPLRGDLKGNWRVRTGDYRAVFYVTEKKAGKAIEHTVCVWKIGNRGDVYD